ncbi:hypothetical protein [Hymenobacter sp. GOD-10R]|uniref:hypothetical protein n=1 Tax=Hymenobacter sp. GOD-10R TaxID=3093922 RepID=UPI002D78867F|nr:hypothetical protein [Hymenobacter sp. GOD-10R]WRQ29135.1 hypothetical protein SD425_02515 [Hymenobacter sp. GOD-10R]
MEPQPFIPATELFQQGLDALGIKHQPYLDEIAARYKWPKQLRHYVVLYENYDRQLDYTFGSYKLPGYIQEDIAALFRNLFL